MSDGFQRMLRGGRWDAVVFGVVVAMMAVGSFRRVPMVMTEIVCGGCW